MIEYNYKLESVYYIAPRETWRKYQQQWPYSNYWIAYAVMPPDMKADGFKVHLVWYDQSGSSGVHVEYIKESTQ